MSNLLELAERCEKAAGPDRDADHDIEVAVNGGRKDLELGFECLVPTVTRNRMRIEVPRYTASLDAAMALVPAGSVWTLEDRAAWVRLLDDDAKDGVAEHQSFAASTPLAICAAALRARHLLAAVGTLPAD